MAWYDKTDYENWVPKNNIYGNKLANKLFITNNKFYYSGTKLEVERCKY